MRGLFGFFFFGFFVWFLFCRVQYCFLCYGLVGRVFANGPGDLGSMPGRVIPKNLKMALDTSLLNTQQYKVRIKCMNGMKNSILGQRSP